MNTTAVSYTTSDLARRVQGVLRGPSDLAIAGINSLEEATDRDITFIADAAHAQRWCDARAGAAVVSDGLEPSRHDPKSRALIVVPNAAVAMIELLRLFQPPTPQPRAGRHPTAVIDPSAEVSPDAHIGPMVCIDQGAVVGPRVVLHAGVRIYCGVRIGEDSILHANAVVRERCQIGCRVIIHQNASIGADGFGFEPAPDGSGLVKVPQIGSVRIEDDVEIGAGACIDRAKFGQTVIGAGTKIDNLVQIGHNCRIGRGCVIAGLTGLGGSATVGDGVRIAGAVGIADHVHVGSGATIAGQSGVMRDVPAGSTVGGSPADDARQKLRELAAMRKLPDWMQRVSRLLKMD